MHPRSWRHDPERRWRVVLATAQAQHGLVSVRQLRVIGVSDAARDHAVDRGRLVPVRRGVLAVAGAPLPWEGEVLGAVLAGGPDTLAFRRSAARLWHLVEPGRRAHSDVIEVVSSRKHELAGVVACRRVVPAAHRDEVRGVPVTSVPLTLVHLAEVVDERELGWAIDMAQRRRLLTDLSPLRRLAAAPARGRPQRGQRVLAAALAARPEGEPPSDSTWERDMDACWDRWGLPPAERQHRIVTPHGRYRPDRAIVELKIAVDWTGYDAHRGREMFDSDSDRRADLVSVGWLPLDFTSRSSPERICRTVLAAVRDRRAAFGLPPI